MSLVLKDLKENLHAFFSRSELDAIPDFTTHRNYWLKSAWEHITYITEVADNLEQSLPWFLCFS